MSTLPPGIVVILSGLVLLGLAIIIEIITSMIELIAKSRRKSEPTACDHSGETFLRTVKERISDHEVKIAFEQSCGCGEIINVSREFVIIDELSLDLS